MRIPTREEQARYGSLNAHDTQRFNVQERTPNASLQINADMFGAGQARAMGEGARALQYGARQVAHWYRENELTKATETFTKYQESLNDDLYGENGIFTSKGEAALDAPKRANDLLKKRAEEFSKNAGNDLGQEFFMQKAAGFNQQLMPRATLHAENERNSWMIATHSAAANNAINEAVKNYSNPEVFNQLMGEAAMNAALAAQKQGLPPEAVKMKRDEAVSKGYFSVGQGLLAAGKYGEAEQLTEKMSGTDALRFKEQAISKRKADLQLSLTMKHEAERNAAKTWEDNLTTALESGDMTLATQIATNAPAGYKREGFALVDHYAKGQRVVTNEDEAWKWRQTLVDDPQKFMDTWNPTDHMTSMDKTTRDKFTNEWEALKKGDKTQYDQVVADATILGNAYKYMGIKDAKKATGDDLSRIMEFNRQFQEQVDTFTQEKKRKPSATEKMGISDNMLITANETGGFLGLGKKKTFAFEVAAEPERPKGLPPSAIWDSAHQGWRMGSKFVSAKDVQ